MTDYDLVRAQIPGKGRGVRTGTPIPAGADVLLFEGPIVGPDRVEDHGLYLQVAPDAFMGFGGGLDDFVNHSCDPTCGLKETPSGQIMLTAIKDLQPGDELTFDYSTWMVDDLWEMACACGLPNCRGRVVDFRHLPPERQRYYQVLGVVPGFVCRAARHLSTEEE